MLPARSGAGVCGLYAMDPPFLQGSVPPLVMLVMGRDHKLYYEAYNDASDLNGDGQLDVGYQPNKIDYYGYFDSFKCYDYSAVNNRFEPRAVTENKKCSSVSGGWSGDFLNYLTMSRMDTIRKVLYGGYRKVDTASDTVLERVFIPQDAHSWGKEYSADDDYNITDYTPLSQPMSGRRHLFASTTLGSVNHPPLLRVLEDVGPWSGDHEMRIWNWVAIERPVAGNQLSGTKDGIGDTRRTIAELRQEAGNQGYLLHVDYHVRVQVCHPDMPEANCRLYPGQVGDGSDEVFKPTGLLQKYGEGDDMYFGLITGSYAKNMSGGVLRKNISSITDEINPITGQFTSVKGIIQTINKLRIYGFRYSDHSYQPGWPGSWVTNRPMNEGEFPDWGNPVAEMMYEGLRYFSGAKEPTPEYVYSGTSPDSDLGLPAPAWEDPFENYPYCAKPIILVISDIHPSFDSDQLPGSAFAASGWSEGRPLGGGNLDVQNRLASLSSSITGQYFIGQSNGDFDSSCTPKEIQGLGKVRGLCPDEPTKQGGYYAGAIAHYGRNIDLQPDLPDTQKVSTFTVALSSPLPRIEIPVQDQVVTIVPFGKSVDASLSNELSNIDPSYGAFQPTNAIVDFFVEEITPTSGRFRINFEDVEQAADHDMDAIVIYEYQVNPDNTVSITLTSEYAAGSIVQHLGYIISGTTTDGTYLDVSNIYNNPHNTAQTDVIYFLDPENPPDSFFYGDVTSNRRWEDPGGTRLPLSATRTFTPSTTPAATLLKDPLWYAAKWGGYEHGRDWDQSGDGVPDHYFYVANPLRLEQQLNRAFRLMLTRQASGSAASVISTSRSGAGALYQAVFWPDRVDDQNNHVTWTGDVHAILVDDYGRLYEDTNSNNKLDIFDKRLIYFFDQSEKKTRACVDGEIVNGHCTGQLRELDEIKYLWSAAEWLNNISDSFIPTNRSFYNSDSDFRYIFTWNDKAGDGAVHDDEVVPFITGNAPDIPFVDAEIIDWIRGLDQEGMRSRQIRVDTSKDGNLDTTVTWRLGDVVHSSPMVVGPPSENYDLFWGDITYSQFYKQYRNRRLMVYFGANDGMLHAVNAGFYNHLNKSFCRTPSCVESGPKLGAEMWAYVPYNILPHLECLTSPNYAHQYYVDLQPRIFDAKIFEPSSTHPGGWGTILVGGMRLGGGYMQDSGTGREFSSSYFILDITDPEQPPTLLGETTIDTGHHACAGNSSCVNFGYTVSTPTLVPIRDNNTMEVAWYLVVGTGPDSDEIIIQSSQKGKVVVIPAKNYLTTSPRKALRIPNKAPSADQAGVKELPSNQSFISSGFVSVDYDFDFFSDILYFGTTERQGNRLGGGMQRLKVENDVDPKNWEFKSMFDAREPVSGAPNIGWHGNDVWVYFGSGKFWTVSDKLNDDVQTIYGLNEPKQTNSNAYNFSQVAKSGLVDVTDILIDESSYALLCAGGGTGCIPNNPHFEVNNFFDLRRHITQYKDGWYRDLSPGERVLGQPTLLGGLLNFTTYSPGGVDDVCDSEGESMLYSLYYLTGTSWIRNVFGQQNPDGYVVFTRSLGPGMTITPSLHLGKQEGAKVFVQTSTGEIIEIDQPELPIKNIRSGRSSWHMQEN